MYQNSANAYQIYQNNNVKTASKEKLLLMLLDGGIKFLRLSIRSLEDGDYEKTNGYLLKSQDIINELMATLNFQAGEIAHQLYSLYEYMNHELVQANIAKDVEGIRNVKEMLEDLRDTWSQII
jgi:flagellar protein FliS